MRNVVNRYEVLNSFELEREYNSVKTDNVVYLMNSIFSLNHILITGNLVGSSSSPVLNTVGVGLCASSVLLTSACALGLTHGVKKQVGLKKELKRRKKEKEATLTGEYND